MKNYIYIFALLICFSFSCSEDSDPIQTCNVDNVLNQPWLQELIAETEQFEIGREYTFISMGTYNSQTVFMLKNCCPFCNSVVPVYDCSGNTLGTIGSEGISADEITDSEVIWKSSNNSCNI